MQPRVIDNYRLDAELGFGGMAVVYRAHDEKLGRNVALKILHDHIASRPENRERFEREARAVAKLEHPNIIHVYGFSSPSAPTQYIACELVDGPTLRELIEKRPFGIPEIAAMLALEVARALAHAHRSGIIHRDIKPENVMVTSKGVPKLMDFGLARILDAQKLTQTGAILGSPAHMSPELIEGEQVDARADVFAFGTVLYFLLTGRLPFDGRNPAVILNSILTGKYPDPERVEPKVSRALGRVVRRCLQTKPQDRYSDAGEVADALEAALEDVGLDHAGKELEAYFADKDSYESELRERLVATLIDRARVAAPESVARAADYCDRVLALDPDNHDAREILAGLESSRKKKTAVLVTAGAAILSGIILAGLQLIASGTSPVDSAPSAPVVEADAPAEPDATEIAVSAGIDAAQIRLDMALGLGVDNARQAALALMDEQERRAVEEAEALSRFVHESGRTMAANIAEQVTIAALAALPRTNRAAEGDDEGSGEQTDESAEVLPGTETGDDDATLNPPAPVLVPVRFRVFPPAARIRVEGQWENFAAAGDRQRVQLPVGEHVLLARQNTQSSQIHRFPFTVTEGGANEFAFDVPFEDAIIIVEADGRVPVFVNNTAVGFTNEEISIAVPGPNPETEINVSAVVDGDRWTESSQVRTGQTVRFNVD